MVKKHRWRTPMILTATMIIGAFASVFTDRNWQGRATALRAADAFNNAAAPIIVFRREQSDGANTSTRAETNQKLLPAARDLAILRFSSAMVVAINYWRGGAAALQTLGRYTERSIMFWLTPVDLGIRSSAMTT